MSGEAQNRPLVFHIHRKEVTEIQPVGVTGQDLPPNLVIAPGFFSFHGRTYSLEEEGLYRFLFPRVENRQRIVYRQDPITLLASISWTASHGSRDNELTLKEWEEIATRQKLVVTCGNIARLGIKLLTDVGIPARRVGARSLAEQNDYDIGHVLMEAKIEGEWILVDLDVKVLFRRQGKRLSLLEAVDAIAEDDYELEGLSKATGIAVASFFDKNGHDFGMYMETAFCSQEAVRAWYKRIMMFPIQHGDDASHYTARNEPDRQLADGLNKKSKYLARDEFVKKYY